jgi:hypothetical protein
VSSAFLTYEDERTIEGGQRAATPEESDAPFDAGTEISAPLERVHAASPEMIAGIRDLVK